ncbi:nuclear factor related to kappa-B-binding protein [Chrysoperla carnea]|uniref:nuclear factor related to kappa-B-binding protein n=1 Tax=Chrysoperla carnea TaxID=189513 RepID=UPI001D063E9B|nr:nuclear factor related to kappa-B-binding protein [Chrysoperla carnea]
MDADSSSSSDEDLSSSECDTDSSSNETQSENYEEAKLFGQRFQLPQGLCENKNVFKELFSPRLWNSLSDANRQHLKKFLPNFPENDSAEKNITLQKLFGSENIGFSNPLDDFHKSLRAGHYRPEIARMRNLMRRVQRRESRAQQRRYLNQLVKDVVASRQWLLNVANSLPPGAMDTARLAPPPPPVKLETIINDPIQRTKRRYFQELDAIRTEVGETGAWSEDENYPEGIDSIPLSSKSKHRRLNVPSSSVITPPESPGADDVNVSTLVSHPPDRNQPQESHMNDEIYKALLLKHKLKRNNQTDKMELNTWGVNLKDIASRTLLSTNNKKTLLNLQKSMSIQQNSEKLANRKTTVKKEPVQHITVSKPNNRFTPINNHHDTKYNLGNHSIPSTTTTITYKDQQSLMGTGNNSSGSELDMSDTESLIDPVMSPKTTIKTSTPMQMQIQKQTTTTSNTLLSSASIANTIDSNISNDLLDDPMLSKTIKTEPTPLTAAPTFNMITSISQYGGKVQPATLSDLEGIDMLNLPVDLDESNIGILDEITRKTPELMQETHASFLSLIRDIICSTPDHRMSYTTLEIRMKSWQENPISPLNDWYNLVDNWLEVLSCAVSFLNGDFPEQPDDFVPYLELKPALQEYQWIGAGRDSDNLLTPLFQYWIEHREEMTAEKATTQPVEVEQNELPKSPPPPRWPTTWTVRKAEPDEIDTFREQERRRYENPHKAFTYRMFGYESVVGPVKGIYNQTAGVTKPRGHSMLSSDRPNFVTILTLVRDATARLPNGEGTRAEICELLKSSQYIAQGASDTVLQSVVSGALDRMHTEYDPCVKYDTKRKIWIYLHRNRTESEFEKIHQQHQGMSKHQKKNNSRKSKAKPKVEKASPQKVPQTSDVLVNNVNTSTTDPLTMAKQRFKTPTNRNATVNTSTSIVNSIPTDPIKSTPAGTSLLINQNANKQSLINKNVLDKIQSSVATNIKVLSQTVLSQAANSPQTLLTNAVNKSSAVTTTVQTLQSIIAPRVNSPVLKPVQQIGGKTGGKSIVKIVNNPQQGKSLINMTAGQLITNHQPPQLFVKQQGVVTSSSGGQVQTIIPSINIKSNQADANLLAQISQQTQKQATIIASHPNTQILQTIVQQPRQTLATRQIIQGISNQQQIVGQKTQSATLLTQGSLPQQIIQVAPGQKIGQTATLVQTKQGGKTVLTSAQQLIQNIKQQTKTAGIQQQTTISNNPQAILKQQVALQQFQKQLQQQTSSTTVKSGTSLLDQSNQRVQTNKTGITNTQAPLVAKVLTNASGQVISVESLLAHQKQHGSLPQGTTLRVAGGKLGQANLIQLSGAVPNQVTQFAVVSQGNLVSLTGQPRLIASVAQQTSQSTSTVNTPQILVATPSKSLPVKNVRQATVQQSNVAKLTVPNKVTHQLINAKFITAQNLTPKLTTTSQASQIKHVNQTPKVVSAATLGKQISKSGTVVSTSQPTAIRMVNPTGGGLNFTHIAGKPILLASKGNTIGGQNIILRQGVAQGTTGSSFVISNSSRTMGQSTTATLTNQNNQIVLGTPLKIQNVNDGSLLTDSSQNKSVDAGGGQQTVLLSTQSSTQDGNTTSLPTQRVVLASQGQGGQLVAQQILLPQGFQGGTINIKTLQGLKVIPLAAQQGKGLTAGRQQLFTRIVNPVSVTTAAVSESSQSSSSNTGTVKVTTHTTER